MPAPDPEHVRQIQEFCRLRGWLINSYAQIEFVLADFALKARYFPEYDHLTGDGFLWGADKRAARVREILACPGPFEVYAAELLPLIERFEAMSPRRQFLAHGFCTFHHTPKGETAMQFRRFIPPKKGEPAMMDAWWVRLDEMERIQASAGIYTQTALDTFRRVYTDLQLEDPDPKNPIVMEPA